MAMSIANASLGEFYSNFQFPYISKFAKNTTKILKQTVNGISLSQKDSVELHKIADTIVLATWFLNG